MLPSPERDPEQVRIRHLVEQAIHDEEPELYLAFAAELLAAARRQPQATSRKLQARRANSKPQTPNPNCRPNAQSAVRAPASESALQTGNWKLQTATMRHRRFPDFNMRTKRIVDKWFRRGLSGWKLAEVGRSLLGPAFPTLQPKPGLHGKSEG
jgi:hypothetical protein